jgi:hypothetical protein
MMEKPFAPSCERNGEAIFETLQPLIGNSSGILFEVAAGTAQHAVLMAPRLPNLTWIVSDRAEIHSGMKLWLDEVKGANIRGPVQYEAGLDQFPAENIDFVFSSNSLHYMPWESAQILFKELEENLKAKAQVFFYGPFNYNNKYISEGNKDLDEWLKTVHPEYAIRDFEAVVEKMKNANFELIKDHSLPANNRLLQFIRN